MQNNKSPNDYKQFSHPFSREYWRCAAGEFKKTNVIAFAAIIIALRVVMKLVYIPVTETVNIYFGYLFNALGSMIYGPLVALGVGAITDTLGYLVAPNGAYFFPYIFVEMLGSFIFALFLYRAKLSETRVILSKFSVSFFCNVVLNSVITAIYYALYLGKNYKIFNVVRIAKNLVFFPVESLLIILFLSAMIPALCSIGLLPKTQRKLSLNKKNIIFLAVMFVVAVIAAVAWMELYGIINLTDKF